MNGMLWRQFNQNLEHVNLSSSLQNLTFDDAFLRHVQFLEVFFDGNCFFSNLILAIRFLQRWQLDFGLSEALLCHGINC